MTPLHNAEAVRAGQERAKRPCVHCGRAIGAGGIKSHERACSLEGREARRLRAIGFSARYRAAHRTDRPQVFRGWTVPDTYLSRKGDLVPCPECDGVKTAYAIMCVRCRIRVGKRRRPIEERFWEKVDKTGGPDACWPFTGAKSVLGYGRLAVPGTHGEIASRVAYRLTVADPGELGVLHRCDNPPCCNPAHLFLGTAADNMRDMVAKGRAGWQKAG